MLLQGADIVVKKLQPRLVEADLSQVNVSRRDGFVSAIDTWILKTSEAFVKSVFDALHRENIQ